METTNTDPLGALASIFVADYPSAPRPEVSIATRAADYRSLASFSYFLAHFSSNPRNRQEPLRQKGLAQFGVLHIFDHFWSFSKGRPKRCHGSILGQLDSIYSIVLEGYLLPDISGGS